MPFSTTGFVNGARRLRYISTETIVLAAATPVNRTHSQFCNYLEVYCTASALVQVKDAAAAVVFSGLLDASTPLCIYLGITAASLTLLSTPGGTMYLNQLTKWEDD